MTVHFQHVGQVLFRFEVIVDMALSSHWIAGRTSFVCLYLASEAEYDDRQRNISQQGKKIVVAMLFDSS